MTKTILVVEDQPNDVLLLQRAMQKAGIENPLQVAADGRQAIDYLQGNGKFADREKFPLPYLILLDLKLPQVPGLQVLKWIRQQPGLRVIVLILTSSGDETDIAQAYQLGANGFLVKPSDLTHLMDLCRAINDFWLRHNVVGDYSATTSVSVRAGNLNAPHK